MKYLLINQTTQNPTPPASDDDESPNGGTYDESHTSGGDYGNQK